MNNTIAGGMIGFGGDLATSYLNNQYAKDAADEQYSRQFKFWEMQNLYNSPAAQRQRLEDAGLNPNMMYANGSMQNTADTAPQVPGNDYAQKGLIRMQMIEKMMQLGMMQADIKLKDAQAKAAYAGAGLSNSQVALNRITERFENEVYELRKLGIIFDNDLKSSQSSLNFTNANDIEQTRQVRIDAMTSQISQAEANAYSMLKAGKLSEIRYQEVQNVIRKMKVEYNILKRQNNFEFNNGDEPLAYLNRSGFMGTGIDLRGLWNKLGASWNIGWNRSTTFRGYKIDAPFFNF